MLGARQRGGRGLLPAGRLHVQSLRAPGELRRRRARDRQGLRLQRGDEQSGRELLHLREDHDHDNDLDHEHDHDVDDEHNHDAVRRTDERCHGGPETELHRMPAEHMQRWGSGSRELVDERLDAELLRGRRQSRLRTSHRCENFGERYFRPGPLPLELQRLRVAGGNKCRAPRGNFWNWPCWAAIVANPPYGRRWSMGSFWQASRTQVRTVGVSQQRAQAAKIPSIWHRHHKAAGLEMTAFCQPRVQHEGAGAVYQNQCILDVIIIVPFAIACGDSPH
mmetsp:Transcript_76475/g.212407  ORF Transcript_76475/g.212407 Transcript_76475/m.212407 type:complete len:278 (+) Transcript_76475:495-1328(+)